MEHEELIEHLQKRIDVIKQNRNDLFDENVKLQADLKVKDEEIERLRKVILLAPGSNEKDFQENYRIWWDTYYREIRTPGCNLKTIEQALKGE